MVINQLVVAGRAATQDPQESHAALSPTPVRLSPFDFGEPGPLPVTVQAARGRRLGS